MRVLVLGGSGFIGSYIVDELLDAGFEVAILGRSLGTHRLVDESLECIECSLSDHSGIERALDKGNYKYVFHLSSSTIPKSSNENVLFDIKENIFDSVNFIQLCIKYGVSRLLYLSSGGTVYGRICESPVSEEHATNPICSYGIGKLTIEKYLNLFYEMTGFEYVALRVSNPYGPRQDPLRGQGVVSAFMYRLLSQSSLTLWGDGSIVRDYVHVRDVAKACLRAILSDACGVYNFGSGSGVSLIELVKKLESVTQSRAIVNWEASRDFDVKEIVLDCTKFHKAFNWKPQIQFDDGLHDLHKWMKNHFI